MSKHWAPSPNRDGMRDYPAITIWQPWASLIAIGAKPLEFRSWAPHPSMQGQRIAIHAGARPLRLNEVKNLLIQLGRPNHFETGLVREIAVPFLEQILPAIESVPRSCIMCTATLGAPIRDEDLERRLGIPHVNDSDRDEHTNYGWPLTDIIPLTPPEPASGRQGWWTWRTATHA